MLILSAIPLNASLGITEIIIIGLIGLLIFAPEKAGDYIASVKKGLSKIKETKKDINEETKDIIEPIQELKKEVNSIKDELTDQLHS